MPKISSITVASTLIKKCIKKMKKFFKKRISDKDETRTTSISNHDSNFLEEEESMMSSDFSVCSCNSSRDWDDGDDTHNESNDIDHILDLESRFKEETALVAFDLFSRYEGFEYEVKMSSDASVCSCDSSNWSNNHDDTTQEDSNDKNYIRNLEIQFKCEKTDILNRCKEISCSI